MVTTKRQRLKLMYEDEDRLKEELAALVAGPQKPTEPSALRVLDDRISSEEVPAYHAIQTGEIKDIFLAADADLSLTDAGAHIAATT